MKHFACGDVVPGCGATFSDPSEDELVQKVSAHAEETHGISSLTPEMTEQVRAAIH